MEPDKYLQQQAKVNAYFQSRTSFWKDVYAEGGVFAETIRDRHAAALNWVDGLALAPGSRVLEVGCGAGLLSTALAQRGLRVHAIDSVESMVEQGRRHAAEAGVADSLCLEVGDVYALAFEDESFDLVIALGVIPWLEQPELAIREMARVTKPAGYVILSTANRTGLPSLLDPRLNPALVPLKRSVKHALERVGLHHRPLEEPPSKTYHYCRFIDETMARAQLDKVKCMTRGFEFSFFRQSPAGTARHGAPPSTAAPGRPGPARIPLHGHGILCSGAARYPGLSSNQ